MRLRETVVPLLVAGGIAGLTYGGIRAVVGHSLDLPTPRSDPAYDRDDWKLWIDADDDCQDTRQEVLVAESTVPVELSEDGCKVVRGVWHDPYTGLVFTNPRQLDVDHLVPLQNAHLSGGARWSAQQKQDYANDLRDPDHLVAVSAKANRRLRSKGAKSPERWLPDQHRCEYAIAWIRVKARWQLAVTKEEVTALLNTIGRECDHLGLHD